MTEIKVSKNRRKKEPPRPTDDVAGYAAFSEAPSRVEERARPVVGAERPIDDHERHRMIAEAAYYRAQRRGFAEGSPERDWLEAEAEVVALLANAGLRA